METKNLPDEELRTLVTMMLNELSKNFNKEIGTIKMEIENIKMNQSEVRNILNK